MFLSLFGGQRRAEDSDRSPYGSFWFEPTGVFTSGGMRVTTANALGHPGVWACVNVLAKSFALMPFELFEMPSGEQRARKKRRDHWLFRLFAKRPNAWQSPFEFRLMLMGHLALRGNAFCQITANASGEVTDLLPLHPDRITIEMLPSGNWRYRYNDQSGKTIYYTRGEIWHLRWMSADGIVGMSPIEMCREAIGEGLAMQGYSSRLFANDARPRGWIEYPGRWENESVKKTFKESWQSAYGGKNQGKVAVLERGMKYHEIKLNNEDLQFIEARGRNLSDICRIFGVPPHKVADLARSTNNNIEHQSIEFWTDTMLPYAECWESSIETFLLGAGEPDAEDLECEFDMARLMRGDGKARAERIAALTNCGVMVPNEGREEEGLDPLPGLDRPRAPLNMGIVQPDGSIEAPEAPDAAGAPEEPDDPVAARQALRLGAMLEASSARLARRAAAELGRKPAAEVFDDGFAGLMAEGLAVPRETAELWCGKFRAAPPADERRMQRLLLTCANGA